MVLFQPIHCRDHIVPGRIAKIVPITRRISVSAECQEEHRISGRGQPFRLIQTFTSTATVSVQQQNRGKILMPRYVPGSQLLSIDCCELNELDCAPRNRWSHFGMDVLGPLCHLIHSEPRCKEPKCYCQPDGNEQAFSPSPGAIVKASTFAFFNYHGFLKFGSSTFLIDCK